MPAWWFFNKDRKPTQTWIDKTVEQKSSSIHEPCRLCNKSFTLSPRKRTKTKARSFLPDCIDCKLQIRWEQEQDAERAQPKPLPGCKCPKERLDKLNPSEWAPAIVLPEFCYLQLITRYGVYLYCCEGSLDKAKARWLRFQEKHKFKELADE